jgi:hypothetical protein
MTRKQCQRPMASKSDFTLATPVRPMVEKTPRKILLFWDKRDRGRKAMGPREGRYPRWQADRKDISNWPEGSQNGQRILHRRTYASFNWAFENERIDEPVRFGTEFKQTTTVSISRARTQSLVFTTEEPARPNLAQLHRFVSNRQSRKARATLPTSAGNSNRASCPSPMRPSGPNRTSNTPW